MELPFTIVFEPPSRSELRALLRMRGPWVAGLIVALTIGAAYLMSNVARADAGTAAGMVALQLTSAPTGADVWLDGRRRGVTPIGLSVEPGTHSVALKASGAVDSDYALNVGASGRAFDAVLWRRTPGVTHLRPALPGATLSDVRLLHGGQVGLSVTLPPGREVEAWSLDPSTGAVQPDMGAMPGTQLAFATDGRHLAFLGPDIGPPAPTGWNSLLGAPAVAAQEQKVVWLYDAANGPDGAGTGWRPPLEPTEQLTDVSWSPQADRLFVVANQPLPGGARQSRAWFVSVADQQAEFVSTLPSDLVPGTSAWSPDGTHVAFVAHAGQLNALCLLGVDGSFRYVADLDPSADRPLGYPPLSWSTDSQQMAFVAPRQRPPGLAFDWLAPATPHAVYVAALDEASPSPITETSLDAVSWRADGQLVGLWRAGPDAPLGIRLLSDSGQRSQDLVQVPLKVGPTYAAVWDQDAAEVLVASTDETAARDYWLVRLGIEDQQ